MKKRWFPFSLAILLPLLTLIILGEGGIYLGAYFSLRDTAYTNLVEDDARDLDSLCSTLEAGGYWSNLLCSTIKKYEELNPQEMPAEGSAEETEYFEKMGTASIAWLGGDISKTLRAYAWDFTGVFYQDNARNRMVLIAGSNPKKSESGGDEAVPIFVGYFFDQSELFTEEAFFGATINTPKLEGMLESGCYLTEIQDAQTENKYPIWAMRITRESQVYEAIPGFSKTFAIVAGGVLVLLVTATYLILRYALLKPLESLNKQGETYTERLKEGQKEEVFQLSDKKYANEMTNLNDSFYYMQQAIDDYSRRFADLTLAKRIQSSMVPSKPLFGKRFLVRGYMKPAKEVGGDLYNYFQIDEDHVAFFIGDVSGKGLAAGLFMARANTILRFMAKDFNIAEANRLLCESNSEFFFVTAFIGVLELSTGKLRYVNAGHEPVYFYHDGQYSPLPEESNFMLGCDENAEYVIQEITLNLGDRLFLYTDGVSEAMDKDGNLFGRQRILDCLNQTKGLPSRDVFPIMMAAIADFVGEAEQSDDAAVVALDYAIEETLSFSPNKEGLALVAPFADSFLEGRKPEVVSPIQVIVDELCTNVVLYSNAKENVHLTLRDDGKSLTGFLIDDGIPFNPLKDKPEHDPDAPGGLGIITAINLSDEMEYSRMEDRNIVRFTKKY